MLWFCFYIYVQYNIEPKLLSLGWSSLHARTTCSDKLRSKTSLNEFLSTKKQSFGFQFFDKKTMKNHHGFHMFPYSLPLCRRFPRRPTAPFAEGPWSVVAAAGPTSLGFAPAAGEHESGGDPVGWRDGTMEWCFNDGTRPGKHTKNDSTCSFIEDLPIKNGGSFHSELLVYQRVNHYRL